MIIKNGYEKPIVGGSCICVWRMGECVIGEIRRSL